MKMQYRVALAVLLSVAIWIVYGILFPPPPPTETEGDAEGEVASEAGEDKADEAVASKPETIEQAELAARGQGAEPAAPVAPDGTAIELVEHRIANDRVALTLSNGPEGLIEGVEPLDEQFQDAEGKGLDFLLLQGLEGGTLDLGFVPGETDFAWASQRGQVVEKDDRNITISRRQGDVEVVESLMLLDAYELRYDVVVRNHRKEGALRHRLALISRMGLGAEQSRYDIHRALCRTPEDLEDFDYDDVEEEDEKIKGGVDWFALDSKYFVQAIIPTERFSGCEVSSDDTGTMLVNTGIGREVSLGPGEQQRYSFALFIGAKQDNLLEAFPASERLADAPDIDLGESIDWGWFGGMSKFLGTMMLDLLRWFYQLTGIWGVAIILLTVVVKLVLLPLTIKQYRAQRRLKEINPELQKLREKYKDDKLKLQQEMQALFQRTGANPLSGCVPLLIQFPVWIALYAMLGAVVDLYHEPFLWLPDLTQPDPWFILPIGMGVLMYVQTTMSPSTGDEAQMKMMRWMMPGIFVVMMLFLPSGLGVYIFANIVLSLIQSAIQLRIPSDAATTAAATESTKAADKPGKGKGGSQKPGKGK